MLISEKGLQFIAAHEGLVLKAYRCPGGVLTIGYGFTNRSPAVVRHLGQIKPGMRITKDEADQVLKTVINQEFGPMTRKAMGTGIEQHQFDMGVSAAYNCGPRVFRWKWLKEFKAGNIVGAAKRWKKTATTARGKKLPGLVRRRAEEADLLEHGQYHPGGMPLFGPVKKITGHKSAYDSDVLKEYQEKLKRLGHYKGHLDGLNGPKTTAAVRAFQKADPHLKNDGILGRATMESIDRTLETRHSIGAGSAGVGVGLFGQAMSYMHFIPTYAVYGLFAIAGILGLYILWKYREAFEIKIRQMLRA